MYVTFDETSFPKLDCSDSSSSCEESDYSANDNSETESGRENSDLFATNTNCFVTREKA